VTMRFWEARLLPFELLLLVRASLGTRNIAIQCGQSGANGIKSCRNHTDPT
jgi:hypothetical protein